MCCSEAFWKRVVVFCLTFGLGVLVSTFFTIREAETTHCPTKTKLLIENQKPENDSLTETKNCVPVDGNLKYERLTAEEKPDLEANKTKDKKKSPKEEKLNNPAEPKPQFYDPSKTDAEIKDLLHRERCFEPQYQK